MIGLTLMAASQPATWRRGWAPSSVPVARPWVNALLLIAAGDRHYAREPAFDMQGCTQG
jgi:hypothetical protein